MSTKTWWKWQLDERDRGRATYFCGTVNEVTVNLPTFEQAHALANAIEAQAKAARYDAHPAPSVPKDDQIAALVNKVRDIAHMFHDHQSLRERIAIELVPALRASQEVKSNAEPVPADVVRDAERYRWLRKTRFIWSDFRYISGVHPTVVGLEFQWFPTQAQKPAREDLDAAIDEAMLAAK